MAFAEMPECACHRQRQSHIKATTHNTTTTATAEASAAGLDAPETAFEEKHTLERNTNSLTAASTRHISHVPHTRRPHLSFVVGSHAGHDDDDDDYDGVAST